MKRDPYTITLINALNEVKKAYPDIKNSFIFSNNGTITSGDPETDEEKIKIIKKSFETIKDEIKFMGNLQRFQVNGKNARLIVSNIKDIYLVLETSEKADKTHIYAITHAIIPTVLKTLEAIGSTPTPVTQSKKLVVDTLSGFFVGNSVEIDAETLIEWAENINSFAYPKATESKKNLEKIVNKVRVKSLKGKVALCRVKRIEDAKRTKKNLIRIPKKLCGKLKVKKGEFVKVKPAL